MQGWGTRARRARLAAGVDVSPIGPSEADDAIIAETVADTVSDGAGAPADPPTVLQGTAMFSSAPEGFSLETSTREHHPSSASGQTGGKSRKLYHEQRPRRTNRRPV